MTDNESVPDAPWPNETDWNRDRGFLTDVDRQFISGAKEYDSSVGRSNRRRSIRERTQNGLQDLKYLPLLEAKQRERIFEQIDEELRPDELRNCIASLTTFLYLGMEDPESWVEDAVEIGVRDGLSATRTGSSWGFPEVSVEIDSNPAHDLDQLEETFKDDHHWLTNEEVGVLVRSGRLSPEAVDDLQSDRENSVIFGDTDSF